MKIVFRTFRPGPVFLAVLLGLYSSGQLQATVLTFGMNSFGGVPANNTDLDVPYGSNVDAGNIIGATNGGEGFTPNIALVWAPTGGIIPLEPDIDILEFHSANTFTNPAGPGFTAPVLQLDVDASNHSALPMHPTVDFIPESGWSVRIHELKIGNATDQGAGETPHPWTISILELPSLTPTGSFYTTGDMGPGSNEIATLNFTGTPGTSYRVLFDDGDLGCTSNACHNPRTAIDNFRFSQVSGSGGVSGDYSGNGKVDAADYTVWRDTLGQSGVGLAADGDGNNSIQQADYVFWRDRFDPNPSSALVGGTAVPEPGAIVIVGLLLLGAFYKHRHSSLTE